MERSMANTERKNPDELNLRAVLDGIEARLGHLLDTRLQEFADSQRHLQDVILGKLGSAPPSPQPHRRSEAYHGQLMSKTNSVASVLGLESASSRPGHPRKRGVPSVAEMEQALMPDLGTLRGIRSMGSGSLSPGVSPAQTRKATQSADLLAIVPEQVKVEPPMDGPSLLPGSTGPTDPPPASDSSEAFKDLSPESDFSKRSRCRKVSGQADRQTDLQDMMRDSQAVILVDCQPAANEESESPAHLEHLEPGVATRTILALPRAIYFLISVLSTCQIAAVAAFLALGYMDSDSLSFSVVSSITFSMVAISCLFFLKRALRSTDLKLAVSRLHSFVADFEVNWYEVSGKEWRKFACAWLLSVLVFIATQVLEAHSKKWSAEVDAEIARVVAPADIALKCLSIFNFTIASAIVMIVAYIQSHLFIGLDKSLDCWCCDMLSHRDFAMGVETWNAMQALLKCVGRELQSSFLALQAFGYLSFLLFLIGPLAVAFRADFVFLPMLAESLAVLPLTVLFLVNLRIFSHAASLTAKCTSIPAFVNQILAEEIIEVNRQYLVQFIKDSAPGFYVANVKLTQEMFAKQIYLVGTLVAWRISMLSALRAG